MNDNEALMIGGVCDGTRCAVDSPRRVGQRLKSDLWSFPDPAAPVEIERSHYRLEWIRSGERKFALYIEIGLSHEQAVELLLQRYAEAS